MNKLITSALLAVSVLSTSVVFAAPPARQDASVPCTQCPMAKKSVTAVALPRAGQYGRTDGACRHGAVANNVRWGNAQTPCPHCNHAA